MGIGKRVFSFELPYPEAARPAAPAAFFFEKIYEHIIAGHLGFVALASYNGEVVGGSVCFHFGDKAVYKYGASDKRCQHLRANNLIMWEAIRHSVRSGHRSFSFGRTEPGNKGLVQFKRGWGAEESAINYFKYDLREKAFIKDKLQLTGFHNKVFAHTPIPLLRLAGSLLYRHVG